MEMLVLSRKFGRSVIIADDIAVTVLGARGYKIKLGIFAPKDLLIRYEGIYAHTQEEQEKQEEQADELIHESYIDDGDMLTLMCAAGEIITIGSNIKIVVVSIQGCQAKIGVEAPKDVSVYCDEVYDRVRAERLKNPKITKRKSHAVISGDIWEKDGNK